uniref:DNA/RNA non-specific endonuclease domain-containing protein n=1 Tax=Meloidogyne incognita TaxID=6306 RepID=A0A914LVZ0_MELIC
MNNLTAGRHGVWSPDPDFSEIFQPKYADYECHPNCIHNHGHLATGNLHPHEQGFYLTNSVPQYNLVNSGHWRVIEEYIRITTVGPHCSVFPREWMLVNYILQDNKRVTRKIIFGITLFNILGCRFIRDCRYNRDCRYIRINTLYGKRSRRNIYLYWTIIFAKSKEKFNGISSCWV